MTLLTAPMAARFSSEGSRLLMQPARLTTFYPSVEMQPFPLEELRRGLTTLATQGVYIGTSSWKYAGWLGQIYSPERYLRYFKSGPPKMMKGRFENTCLKEYPETFKTVCLDAGFYQFPSAKLLDGYFF